MVTLTPTQPETPSRRKRKADIPHTPTRRAPILNSNGYLSDELELESKRRQSFRSSEQNSGSRIHSRQQPLPHHHRDGSANSGSGSQASSSQTSSSSISLSDSSHLAKNTLTRVDQGLVIPSADPAEERRLAKMQAYLDKSVRKDGIKAWKRWCKTKEYKGDDKYEVTPQKAMIYVDEILKAKEREKRQRFHVLGNAGNPDTAAEELLRPLIGLWEEQSNARPADSLKSLEKLVTILQDISIDLNSAASTLDLSLTGPRKPKEDVALAMLRYAQQNGQQDKLPESVPTHPLLLSAMEAYFEFAKVFARAMELVPTTPQDGSQTAPGSNGSPSIATSPPLRIPTRHLARQHMATNSPLRNSNALVRQFDLPSISAQSGPGSKNPFEDGEKDEDEEPIVVGGEKEKNRSDSGSEYLTGSEISYGSSTSDTSSKSEDDDSSWSEQDFFVSTKRPVLPVPRPRPPTPPPPPPPATKAPATKVPTARRSGPPPPASSILHEAPTMLLTPTRSSARRTRTVSSPVVAPVTPSRKNVTRSGGNSTPSKRTATLSNGDATPSNKNATPTRKIARVQRASRAAESNVLSGSLAEPLHLDFLASEFELPVEGQMPAATPEHHYTMNPGVESIRQCLQEWRDGLLGKPSLQSLNRQYGGLWIEPLQERQYYARLEVIKAFRREVLECKKEEKEVIAALQKNLGPHAFTAPTSWMAEVTEKEKREVLNALNPESDDEEEEMVEQVVAVTTPVASMVGALLHLGQPFVLPADKFPLPIHDGVVTVGDVWKEWKEGWEGSSALKDFLAALTNKRPWMMRNYVQYKDRFLIKWGIVRQIETKIEVKKQEWVTDIPKEVMERMEEECLLEAIEDLDRVRMANKGGLDSLVSSKLAKSKFTLQTRDAIEQMLAGPDSRDRAGDEVCQLQFTPQATRRTIAEGLVDAPPPRTPSIFYTPRRDVGSSSPRSVRRGTIGGTMDEDVEFETKSEDLGLLFGASVPEPPLTPRQLEKRPKRSGSGV